MLKSYRNTLELILKNFMDETPKNTICMILLYCKNLQMLQQIKMRGQKVLRNGSSRNITLGKTIWMCKLVGAWKTVMLLQSVSVPYPQRTERLVFDSSVLSMLNISSLCSWLTLSSPKCQYFEMFVF